MVMSNVMQVLGSGFIYIYMYIYAYSEVDTCNRCKNTACDAIEHISEAR